MANSFHKALDLRLQEYINYSELKQLAYNIAALQQEKMFHTLAVLSSLPGEGKTLFCAALAMAYVETCHTKVLIVNTTTFQNKRSLNLKECFNGLTPFVEIASLEDLRKNSNGYMPPSARPARPNKEAILEPEIVTTRPPVSNAAMAIENDFSLIKRVTEERSKDYGLVLLDTAALQTKNRSNVDPILVARLSTASVLVVSRKLLDSGNLNASLKVLDDPSLHLIGMISNEDYSQ